MRPDGVTFNGRHSFDEFGLVLNSKTITPPEQKKQEVDVIGANGKLDLSTANTDGIVKYHNRLITLNFSLVCPIRRREAAFSRILNGLHCRYMDVIFDIDPEFYWHGKVEIVTRQDESIAHGLVTMTIDAEPYKYAVSNSTDDWLWDPFDFRTGIIYKNLNNAEVYPGSTTFIVPVLGMPMVPTFITDKPISVTFRGVTYSVPSGTSVVPNIVITERDNVLQVSATQRTILTIQVRGGSL